MDGCSRITPHLSDEGQVGNTIHFEGPQQVLVARLHAIQCDEIHIVLVLVLHIPH